MTAAAGWFDDPDVSGGERWWDGSGWTNDRRPKQTTWRTPQPYPPPPPYPTSGPQPSSYPPPQQPWYPPPELRFTRSIDKNKRWLIIIAVVAILVAFGVTVLIASRTDDRSYDLGHNEFGPAAVSLVQNGLQNSDACSNVATMRFTFSQPSEWYDSSDAMRGCVTYLHEKGFTGEGYDSPGFQNTIGPDGKLH
jgi:hypothetical protein